MSYDGTNYCGFQIQPNCLTIQEVLEKALYKIFKTSIRINYAGRTDAGVHAFGQVIDFLPPFFISPYALFKGLNSVLPNDIRILKVFEVNNDFHSRYSARFREYVYFIFNGSVLPPFLKNYVWHVPLRLDIEKIKEFVCGFVGKMDFSLFANEPLDKDCVREVYFFRVRRFRDFAVFHICANGFLRGMVRNMVGLAVGYSLMRLQKDTSGNIIFNVGNVKSFKAPAKGLFLRRVGY